MRLVYEEVAAERNADELGIFNAVVLVHLLWAAREERRRFDCMTLKINEFRNATLHQQIYCVALLAMRDLQSPQDLERIDTNDGEVGCAGAIAEVINRNGFVCLSLGRYHLSLFSKAPVHTTGLKRNTPRKPDTVPKGQTSNPF